MARASITANPTNPSNNAGPSFSFSSEGGASFQCQLDGGGFAACSSPKGYTGEVYVHGRAYGYGVVPMPSLGEGSALVIARAEAPL